MRAIYYEIRDTYNGNNPATLIPFATFSTLAIDWINQAMGYVAVWPPDRERMEIPAEPGNPPQPAQTQEPTPPVVEPHPTQNPAADRQGMAEELQNERDYFRRLANDCASHPTPLKYALD